MLSRVAPPNLRWTISSRAVYNGREPMAGAGFTQTGFHGGEWSKLAQGLMADEAYKIAMNVCFNGLPMEEGAWTRRPGFYHVANTRLGGQALVIPFIETEGEQYTIEL